MNQPPRIIVVNEEDEIIGHKERGSLERHDVYRVSSLWITNSIGQILLAQRKFTKKHDPGKWGPAVAGTLEEGETYASNIIKEAEEELGLRDIQPTPRIKQRISDDHEYFVQWYTLVLDRPITSFTIAEDEIEQIRWFTREELTEDFFKHPALHFKHTLTTADALAE